MNPFPSYRINRYLTVYFRSPTLVGPPLHQSIETVTIFKCSNWIPPWTRIHMLATNIPQATIKFKTSRNPQSFNHDPSLRSQGIDGQSLLSCLPRALPRCVFSRITELELPYVHFKKPNDAVRFVRSFPDAEKCTYVTLKDDHAPDAVGLHPDGQDHLVFPSVSFMPNNTTSRSNSSSRWLHLPLGSGCVWEEMHGVW